MQCKNKKQQQHYPIDFDDEIDANVTTKIAYTKFSDKNLKVGFFLRLSAESNRKKFSANLVVNARIGITLVAVSFW